jgi:hypothetical protein
VIDFDPTRMEPEANAAEREASRVLMDEVRTFLLPWGFPEPWAVMSGNGYQLRYRVDLPADSLSERLLKSVMTVLDKTFTNEAVKVDTSLWDLPRVCKIPGTYSRKGMKRTPLSRQKRAIIKIECYTDELKYTAAGVR